VGSGVDRITQYETRIKPTIMAFWIEGWVEILRSAPDEGLWFGVIDIGALIDVADEVSEALFGLSKECVRGEKPIVPSAAGRGLPSDPSSAVCTETERISAHEAQFGAGEIGGYTHATSAELKLHPLDPDTLGKSDWRL